MGLFDGGRLDNVPAVTGVLQNDNGPNEEWLKTVNGAPYRFLLKLQEAAELDATQSNAWIDTQYDKVYTFKTDMMGSSSFTPGKNRLNRVLPMQHGYYSTQHLKRMDLEGFQGSKPDPAHIKADPLTGFPRISGYAQYRLLYVNFPYAIVSDDKLVTTEANCPPELQRYCRLTRVYMPESRKVPTAGFSVIYDATVPNAGASFTPIVIQEIGSIPTFQIELTIESVQWPIQNVPDLAIEKCIGTVNSLPIRLGTRGISPILNPGSANPIGGNIVGGRIYKPGTLLFKGMGRAIEPYTWIDGEQYADLHFLFGFRPQGWNFHRLHDGRWMPVVVKGTEPAPVGDGTKKPQFLSEDHTTLFIPEAGL